MKNSKTGGGRAVYWYPRGLKPLGSDEMLRHLQTRFMRARQLDDSTGDLRAGRYLSAGNSERFEAFQKDRLRMIISEMERLPGQRAMAFPPRLQESLKSHRRLF